MNDSTGDVERLAAVQRYHTLDTPPDAAFDRITALAARLFQVPIALITVVDRDRIWFKSRHGLAIEQIDREPGLCASAILQGEVYTIADARQDPRTLTNSLVRGEFGLRFYAAAPLTTQDGYNLGTLCIIDRQPRRFTADEAQTLADLAAVVMDQLELRQLNQSLEASSADRNAELADRNAELEASNQALHLSNQRFRNAFDYAGIGMALTSLEGHWLEVNPALCEITGYTEAELLITDFQSLTHPDDLETDLDLMGQVIRRDIRHYHLEKRYRHKQGHWTWIMLSCSLVCDLQQTPLYFVSQIQDINDRKQSEIALHKSQAMLLEAQKIGHIGSWEYDVTTQKVTWSAEKFRILGRDPTLGAPSFDELLRLYHPEDGDRLRAMVEHTLTTGEPYSMRLKCTRSDGETRYLDDRGQAERNAEGDIVRLFGIAQDITDRVQAEGELREMSTALAHAVEGISRLDATGHYTSVNQAYAAMVGYTPDELVGQPWAITVHPDDLEQVVQAYEQMLAEGQVNVEARGVRKDGSIFHKQLFMVLAYDDQSHGHYCFMKDITEKARLEADRKQAELALRQELQRLSKVVETQQEVTLLNPHLQLVMAVIVERALQLTRADGVAVELLEGKELVCQAAGGIAQAHRGWRLPVADSLSGRCLTENQVLYCADGDRDRRVNRSLAETLGLRSIVVVPLTAQTEPVGVIKVFSTQAFAFTESDRQTLQLMAGLLAASLHLAREFEAKTTLLQDLQDSEERYRSVVAALSEGVAVVRADGTLLTCNASAAKIVGLQSWQIVGRSLADMTLSFIQDDGSPCPDDDHPAWITLRTGQPVNNRLLGLVKPHGTTWISCNTRPLQHPDDPLPYAVVLSFTDITELRRSEVAALRRRAEQERLLSEIAQRIRQTLDLEAILTTTVTEVQQFLRTDRVMIYRFEADGSGTVIAEAVTAGPPALLGRKLQTAADTTYLGGYLRGEVRACADIQTEEAVPCPMDRLTQAQAKVLVPIVQGNSLWGMLLAYHSQSPRPWEASELDVLKRLATQLAIAIQQSQLYQHVQTVNRQLEHLATHDGLTQLANRRSFDIHLQQEWARLLRIQAPLSLILCDIDHFKPYNDTYGHPAGDVCLQQVAQTLEQVVQRPADMVARYGGEEFALVLPNTDQAGAEAIARTIQQALVDLALFHGASPLGQRLTLSLGIASVIPTADQKAQTLIDQADAALYSAKQRGRDRYCVAPAVL
ncbi:PAS domain S-box protein [Leptolyngbya sp. CCNP1308]|uniref:PAS domain S-box protein n=1 Tax=Leptolyngbya sp. CCNP1308 TaxID=3110255 RepID=UPI002B1F29D9|nr:PAS domain S-box protein [Leptolyngbya sp. CCNP1308]MEA5451613.1 PAS domain S-box protein [Leptolyngbya sp. CCNP1308]